MFRSLSTSLITCHGTSPILPQCSYFIDLFCSLTVWNSCLRQCLTLTVHYSCNAFPKSPQSTSFSLVRFQLKCKLYRESPLNFLSTHLITSNWVFCFARNIYHYLKPYYFSLFLVIVCLSHLNLSFRIRVTLSHSLLYHQCLEQCLTHPHLLNEWRSMF